MDRPLIPPSRSLLETESAAAHYAQALRSAGLATAGAFDDGPALDLLAQVLATLGDPADVIEGQIGHRDEPAVYQDRQSTRGNGLLRLNTRR